MKEIRVYLPPEESVRNLRAEVEKLKKELPFTHASTSIEVAKRFPVLSQVQRENLLKLRKKLLETMAHSLQHAEKVAQLSRKEPLVFSLLMSTAVHVAGLPKRTEEEAEIILTEMGFPVRWDFEDMLQRHGPLTTTSILLSYGREHPLPYSKVPFFFWLKGLLPANALHNSGLPIENSDHLDLAVRLITALMENPPLYEEFTFFFKPPAVASIAAPPFIYDMKKLSEVFDRLNSRIRDKLPSMDAATVATWALEMASLKLASEVA